MNFAIDHLILGASDFDRGLNELKERTGILPQMGGSHPAWGTRNALLGLGPNMYLELLAPDPPAPLKSRFDLADLSKVEPVGWAISITDPDSAREFLMGEGYRVEEPKPGKRICPDGGVLEWQSFDLIDPPFEYAPFFIHWISVESHPARTSPQGLRLKKLEFVLPEGGQMKRFTDLLKFPAAIESGHEATWRYVLSSPQGEVIF